MFSVSFTIHVIRVVFYNIFLIFANFRKNTKDKTMVLPTAITHSVHFFYSTVCFSMALFHLSYFIDQDVAF